MPRAFLGSMAYQEGRQRVAVAGEEPHAAEQALLQVAIGVEVQHDGRRVLVQRCLFLQLEVRSHAA